MKTNRRDAVSLAKLLRAGELTAVWVLDERHEAMRNLSRARLAVKKDLQGKRQQISSFFGTPLGADGSVATVSIWVIAIHAKSPVVWRGHRAMRQYRSPD